VVLHELIEFTFPQAPIVFIKPVRLQIRLYPSAIVALIVV
jgi:hypothetical protein